MDDSTMLVLVLGHRGMLGNCVASFFRKANYQVRTIDSRWDTNEFKREVLDFGGNYIVNCIGSFPNKKSSDSEIILNNYELPLWIMNRSPSKQIVAGSDAEYSGSLEPGKYYGVDSASDAKDTYGKYKAKLSELAAQNNNLRVIRTSIIGIEQATTRSLVNWVLSREDGDVIDGYSNVLWNGVTTLEWAKTCARLMRDWNGNETNSLRVYRNIVQIGTKPVSKLELIHHIATTFRKKLHIQSVKIENSSNRCLLPSNPTDDIQNQLGELKEYYGL